MTAQSASGITMHVIILVDLKPFNDVYVQAPVDGG